MADTRTPILKFDSLDSTNEEAKRHALAQKAGPVWIMARRQTAGRGRRGRNWVSPVGNLYASGLYYLETSAAEAANLSFAAALAVGDVCASAIDEPAIQLKWPNDVLIKGCKVSGILLESGHYKTTGLWLAVGIGINITHHPDDQDRASCDLKELGANLDADEALNRLSQRFDYWLNIWKSEGFAPIRQAWLARAYGLGQTCRVQLDSQTLTGVFADLGATGELRLDLKTGERQYISAGDVFFPSTD